ncbi:MAG: MipA/OmpV family protein [Alphaproteobacteria bacterium]|nr:MipA/OmpV family protein [Alphaproteobacteria bacterium]
MRITLAVLAGLAAVAAARPAEAQVSAPEQNVDTLPRFGAASDWRVTVGAAAFLRPEWDGADDLSPLAVPDIDVRWRDKFFASVRTGVGYNVVSADGWRIGPYAKVKFGRDESDDRALRGLGDVDATAEIGGFAEKSWRFARASLEVRQGVGGHEGLVVEAGGDLRFRLSERVALSAGPRLRAVSDDYMQTYFGVTPAQSARSGLPTFAAGGGLESVGLAGAIVLRPQPRTTVTLFAEQSRLLGDAADSPLVQLRGSENQTRLGIGVGYRLGASAR